MSNTPVRVGRYTNADRIRVKGNGVVVVVGSFCAIGQGITIIPVNHNYELPALCMRLKGLVRITDPHINKGPVIIGNDVWIGDSAIILSGATIGNGAIIGAGAVVTRPCSHYSINVGVPAKQVKTRFSPEVIDWLLELSWWDWSDDRIRRNAKFFNTNLNSHPLKYLKGLIND